MLFFGDETLSRRRFCAGNSFFWRRHPFSSSFLDGKLTFLATTPFLIVVLRRKTHFFGDETRSRRRFEAKNSLFWRRHPFSSSFLDGKLTFLATRPLIVVVFVRKSPLFSDETLSRRRFCTEISTFWRRNPLSSSLLDGEPTFLATKPLIVVIFVRKSPLFGDETLPRRRFCAENSFFWRRNPLSSSFLCGKLTFLATKPFLVVVLRPKTHFFGDETPSRRHFWTENSLFWRRNVLVVIFMRR